MRQAEAEIPAPWKWLVRTAGENVIHFYESSGTLENAKAWREKLAKSQSSPK
jgi:hypothetical protein